MHRHLLQFNGRVIEVRVTEFDDRVLVTISASKEMATSTAEYHEIYQWFRQIIKPCIGKYTQVLDPQHVLTT